MRFLATLAILFIVSAPPLVAHAATANFFGPIVPEECNCEDVGGKQTAPSYGCVLATLQNAVNFAISLGVIAATLVLAYAGFTWMMSGGNPEKRSQGRTMLINVAIGLAIVLSAWLIVDFIMKNLYDPGTSAHEVQFGPWYSILRGDEGTMCILIVEQQTIPGLLGGLATGVLGGSQGSNAGGGSGNGGSGGGGGGSGANCPAADPSTMVAFPSSVVNGDPEKATATTVQNFLNMRAAALRDGINLKVTDGYRPESEQVYLWNNRGRIGAVARPCTMGGNGSNHNSGEAIDIAVGCSNGNSNCNTAAYRWLQQNGGTYHFRNAVRSDPVHWSPSGS